MTSFNVPPHPGSSSPALSERMSKARRRDTGPEVLLRRELHRRGRRFRVVMKVPGNNRRTIDIAFTKQKLAVFVDGCFWHGCPEHGSSPSSNQAWWATKIAANRARDDDTNRLLDESGWIVLRFWEHESPSVAASTIEAQLDSCNSLSADRAPPTAEAKLTKDDDRRATAGDRRERIIATFTRELDHSDPRSAASRLDELLRGNPRCMIVSGDIDGLVSAAMLRRAVPAWDAVAVIAKSGQVLLHPDVVNNLELGECFGVDVFSSYIPNVSNHVVLWGGKRPASSVPAGIAADAHDECVRQRAEEILLATPSLWAGIEGSYPDSAQRPTSAEFRYPLGTAQILLALLEVAGRPPKLFDREYLPWLVANCDGGLKTIRDYPYNVPMWWSALAAAVGPASVSEQIYQVAATQRPTEFVDAVNRLRTESHLVKGAPAASLDEKWNLRSPTVEAIAPVTRWITSLSGWPDPFRGGAENLKEWREVVLDERGKLSTSGLPTASSEDEKVELFKAHLRASLNAVHTNFAFYNESQRLNWVSPWPGASPPQSLTFPRVLQPSSGARLDVEGMANSQDEIVI